MLSREDYEKLSKLQSKLTAEIMPMVMTEPHHHYVHGVGIGLREGQNRLVVQLLPNTPEDITKRLPVSYEGEKIFYEIKQPIVRSTG